MYIYFRNICFTYCYFFTRACSTCILLVSKKRRTNAQPVQPNLLLRLVAMGVLPCTGRDAHPIRIGVKRPALAYWESSTTSPYLPPHAISSALSGRTPSSTSDSRTPAPNYHAPPEPVPAAVVREEHGYAFVVVIGGARPRRHRRGARPHRHQRGARPRRRRRGAREAHHAGEPELEPAVPWPPAARTGSLLRATARHREGEEDGVPHFAVVHVGEEG